MKKYLSTAGAAALASALALAGVAHATDTTFAGTGQTIPVGFVADSPIDGGGYAATSSPQVTNFTIQYGPLAGTTVAATMALDFTVQPAGPSDHNWINSTTVLTPGKYHYTVGGVLHSGLTFAQTLGHRTAAFKFGQDFTYQPTGVTAVVSIADFAITYTGVNTTYTVGGVQYGLKTGENLLSGSGLSGILQGNSATNGVTLTFGNTAPAAGQDFTSQLFNFTGATDEVVSLTDAANHIVVTNTGTLLSPIYSIASQTWNFNGNYASNPGPITNPIPEPASWAMMLVGFGAVGAMARRRKIVAAA